MTAQHSPSSYGDLIEDQMADGIVRFSINRAAHMNTLTLPLLARLEERLAALTIAKSARVVVIRGLGGAAFSAGYDIDALNAGLDLGADGLCAVDRRLDSAFTAIERAPMPVIAQIEGHCIGGGFELAMACDLRIASDTARFRMPPARLGWVYAAAGLQRFVRAAGSARTRHLFLTAETLTAERAERWGLIGEVCAAADLEARVTALCQTLAAGAPLSLAGTKQALTAMDAHGMDRKSQAWTDHLELRRAALQSADLAEARDAFLARRPPRFRGC